MAIDWREALGIGERELIAASDQYRLTGYRELPPGFAERLAGIHFGTAGLRYRRPEIARVLDALPQPVFIELCKNETAIGTYVVSFVPLRLGASDALGAYRSMLSVVATEAGQGAGRWMVENSLEWLADLCRALDRPALSWGCVERDNRRSAELLGAVGADMLGSLESLMVYRQWPRGKLTVRTPGRSLRDDLAERSFRVFDDCGSAVIVRIDEHYRVAELRNGAMLGARAVPQRLCLERIGGHWDAIYRRLLRHSPAARRRFDPEDFRFLRLTDLVVDRDTVDAWPDFISSLLHEHECHMAMFVVDRRGGPGRLLEEAGIFGRFAAATRTDIDVHGRMLAGDSALVADVRRAPLGLIPLDA